MTNNTTAALTDEQRIRASMTGEQIRLERKLTCEAIEGAIGFGQQGTNPPPSEDHWLAPFWKIGQQLALLTSPRAAVPPFSKHELTAIRGLLVGSGYTALMSKVVKMEREVDAAPAAPVAEAAPYFSGVSELIIRDVCEMEPANPDLSDTICIDVSDLQTIVKRHTESPEAQAVAADGAIPTPEDVQSWAVTVEVNGMTILTISDSHVGGIDSIGDFGDVVRSCAQHLTSFIGKDDAERAAVSPAMADTTWTAPKQHCQNGGDVCLAGNRDGVCCPDDSCDIDDGTRKKPATADERAALQWTAGTLQEIVSGRWKGAKESDKVSIGSVTKTVAQVLDMADAALGRASQAAAPAEAREPIYQSRLLKAPAWTDVSRTEFEACAAKPDQFETRTLSRVPADAGEAVASVSISKPGDSLTGVSFMSLTEHGRQTLGKGKHLLYVAPPAGAGDAGAWESAESDTPNDEREVIVLLNGHCTLTDMECRKGGGWGIRLGFYDHEKRYWRVHGKKEYFVTHWRDLPEPPDSAPLASARVQGAQGGKSEEADCGCATNQACAMKKNGSCWRAD